MLFPFGYGLSYTTFAYTNPKVSSETIKDVEGVTVSVDVTNTGNRSGKEVVQVYVHDRECSLMRPPKELKGFAKVQIQPGETKTVSIKLDFRAFAFYHPAYKQWITEEGEFDILIGSSSADIQCMQTIHLRSTLDLPSLLNKESTLRQWMIDQRGKQVIDPYVQQINEHIKAIFGDAADAAGMDTLGFLMDMPLTDLFTFFDSGSDTSPAEIAQGLLAQVNVGK